MYYLELIQRFWSFNQNNNVGSSVVSLYLYLLKLGYDNDSYEVKISDLSLSKELAMTRKTIKSTKDKMKGYGLIDFSTKIGLACTYRIMLNYSVQKYREEGADRSGSTAVADNDENLNSCALGVSEYNDTKDLKTTGNTRAIPMLTEFIHFATTLHLYDPSLDSLLVERYDSWRNNGWRSSSKRPITNWKSTLKSILPYLSKGNDPASDDLRTIPNIDRP